VQNQIRLMVHFKTKSHDQSIFMKLLIVEHSRSQLSRLLGIVDAIEAPKTVLTASSLAHAFEVLQLEKPALVIVDMHMPDGNAIQGIKRMKGILPGARIAALAFEPSAFDRTWCLDAGADFVLDKATECGALSDIVLSMGGESK
jgi:DNA-binding NarL/FixJ family response regulator